MYVYMYVYDSYDNSDIDDGIDFDVRYIIFYVFISFYIMSR